MHSWVTAPHENVCWHEMCKKNLSSGFISAPSDFRGRKRRRKWNHFYGCNYLPTFFTPASHHQSIFKIGAWNFPHVFPLLFKALALHPHSRLAEECLRARATPPSPGDVSTFGRGGPRRGDAPRPPRAPGEPGRVLIFLSFLSYMLIVPLQQNNLIIMLISGRAVEVFHFITY